MTENSKNATSTTSLGRLIDFIAGPDDVDEELAARLSSVRDLLVEPDDMPRPFLTVLLRTQGKREESLKDALLCLSAQTDRDFEVIVLEHDAFPENAADVRRVLDRQPPELAARLTLVEVTGGTRSRPLNEGIRMARGHYVAVFDDDDLVFANWVEEFHKASLRGDGRLLRANVATQNVQPELWPQDQDGFRTFTWPAAEYERYFDQLQHMLVNHSPFMSWAFPRSLFYTFGVRFDEELTVCEDWDVILRGSLLCGVDDIDVLTSIYRRWVGGESSYTKHSEASWRESEQRVIDRLNNAVIMLPPGSVQGIRDLVLFNDGLKSYRFLFRGNQLRPPLNWAWTMARPLVKSAVRVRSKLRRLRAH